jgi:pimeloyl-ACP methyl ester carboxylesterase
LDVNDSVAEREIRASVPGGEIVGHLSGSGPPALLLHGGPGLSDYLAGLAAELAPLFTIVRYQQRGLAPSVTDGEPTVETHVADAVAVLDSLGWERAWVMGHSWGGHLAMHIAVAHPDRVVGLVAIDPQGAVGDGGAAALVENLMARLSPDKRERVVELDERATRGEATPDEALEMLTLVWPSYFARPDVAPPMPPIRLNEEGFVATDRSIQDHFARRTLQDGLPRVSAPALFIHGDGSPIPYAESERSAALMPTGSFVLLAGVGHFTWLERPGVVRAEVERFSNGTPGM